MTERATGRLLSLLQHGDSQFPAGSFASSFGLEGLLADELAGGSDLRDCLRAMLRGRWAPFDRVLLLQCWRCSEDWSALAAHERDFDKAILVPVERTASLRSGRALLQTHKRLETPPAASLDERIRAGEILGHRVLVEAIMWRGLGWDQQQAALLSAYLFVNGLATAAVRLGCLGALEQQQLVSQLLPEIESLCASAVPGMARSFNPFAEIAMMRQPRRNGHLFAN